VWVCVCVCVCVCGVCVCVYVCVCVSVCVVYVCVVYLWAQIAFYSIQIAFLDFWAMILCVDMSKNLLVALFHSRLSPKELAKKARDNNSRTYC